MKTGRKSKFEELEIVKRYADLSEPSFLFIKEMFDSGDKADKKWAVEQLGKAYVKMIPQDVTSGGEPLQIQVLRYGEETDSTS